MTKPASFDTLNAVFKRMLRRWRFRRVLDVFAVVFTVALIGIVILIVAMNQAQFEPQRVELVRRFGWLLVLVCALLAIGMLAAIRVSRRALVRRIEQDNPDLDGLVLTSFDRLAANEQPPSPQSDNESPQSHSPALEQRLSEQAAKALDGYGISRRLDGQHVVRAVLCTLSAALIFIAIITLGPEFFRHGTHLLTHRDADPAAGNPYSISVEPGDISVLEGEDLRIGASTTGFTPERIELFSRADATQAWTTESMEAVTDTSDGFELFYFDVDSNREYYVEADGFKSDTHKIEVINRPEVKNMDVVYEYPDYTGRAPDRISDADDLKAIKGTVANFEINADEQTKRGRLVLDDGSAIDLEPIESGPQRVVGEDGKTVSVTRLSANLPIETDGSYHIELEASDGRLITATPEYAIFATEDELPQVRVDVPGRDTRVTSVSEVSFAVSASDDVALNGVELVLSINGEAEQAVALENLVNPDNERQADADADAEKSSTDATRLESEHRLYLEQKNLQPGDLIAYYARARDSNADDTRQAATDMYFIDVRPFEQNFRSANGGGSGGGGGGGQSEDTLSAQQRTLVVALFKLSRDQKTLEADQRQQRIDTLIEAENRIRDRVDAIVRRLKARSIVDLSPAYQRMIEELPQASTAMVSVTSLLGEDDVDAALPEANKALLHLQRADAAMRDVMVSQGQSGQSGSASSDLSNLFRLEMDKFENKYADVKRNQQREQQVEIDETMRKLEEIARRQQAEIERAQLRGEQTANDGTSSSQAELAQAVEELIRKLRRLTRKRPQGSNPDSDELIARASEDGSESGDQSSDPSTGQQDSDSSNEQQQGEGQQSQGQGQQSQGEGQQSQGQGQQSQGEGQQSQGQGQQSQGQGQQSQDQGQQSQGQGQQSQGQGQQSQGQDQGQQQDQQPGDGQESQNQGQQQTAASDQSGTGENQESNSNNDGSSDQQTDQDGQAGGTDGNELADDSGENTANDGAETGDALATDDGNASETGQTGDTAAGAEGDPGESAEQRERQQQIAETMRQLEAAVEQMRRSADASDPQAARRALDILREARGLLDGNGEQGSEGDQSAQQLQDIVRSMRSTGQQISGGYGNGERQISQTDSSRRIDADLRGQVSPQQLTNSVDQQVEQLIGVVDGLRDFDRVAENIDDIVEQLRDVRNRANSLSDSESNRAELDRVMDAYMKAFEELKRVEFGARDGTTPTDTRERVISAQQARSSDEDQDLVNRYFRDLSDKQQAQ